MIGSSLTDVCNISLFLKWLSSPDCGIKCRTHQINEFLSASAISWMTNATASNSFLSPFVTLPASSRSRPSASWFFSLNVYFGESWYTVITIVIVCFSFAVFILWLVWLCYIGRCIYFLCSPTFLGWNSAAPRSSASTAHRKRASCCRRTPLQDKWPFWPFCIVWLLIDTDKSTIFVVHRNESMIELKANDYDNYGFGTYNNKLIDNYALSYDLTTWL